MRLYWFAVSQQGRHDVVAGLLRDGQLELALEEMRVMRIENVPIQDWLYSLTVCVLIHHEQFDEALRILDHWSSFQAYEASVNIWSYLLDSASRCLHVSFL